MIGDSECTANHDMIVGQLKRSRNMLDVSLLNENQKDAVLSDARYIRVIAGAGSGKTRVLTMRIVHLIED